MIMTYNKSKKNYYRNGDVPRIKATVSIGDTCTWSLEGKSVVAKAHSNSVELLSSEELVASFSSAEAYKLGRKVFRGEEDKDSNQAQWGKMLCSAAEYAAL